MARMCACGEYDYSYLVNAAHLTLPAEDKRLVMCYRCVSNLFKARPPFKAKEYFYGEQEEQPKTIMVYTREDNYSELVFIIMDGLGLTVTSVNGRIPTFLVYEKARAWIENRQIHAARILALGVEEYKKHPMKEKFVIW